MALIDNFGGIMARDLFNLVTGDELGCGQGRTVYEFGPDRDYVIKFEDKGGSFQNVMEWELWQALKDHAKAAAWLAPCIRISPCGSILMQRRTRPLGDDQLPEQVPVWATDLKPDNWGLLEGRPVMHDYGYTRLLGTASGTRLRKANWNH